MIGFLFTAGWNVKIKASFGHLLLPSLWIPHIPFISFWLLVQDREMLESLCTIYNTISLLKKKNVMLKKWKAEFCLSLLFLFSLCYDWCWWFIDILGCYTIIILCSLYMSWNLQLTGYCIWWSNPSHFV